MKIFCKLALAATIYSTAAQAHTLNLVGRTGWRYQDNDSAGVANSSSFNMDYLRTTFDGDVSSSVKYYFTLDILAANGETDTTDNTSPFIDEAFVTKSLPSATHFSLGKKAVLVGGRENDYVDYDRYTSSAFKIAAPSSQLGLTVSQEFRGNTFIAQYFNGNKNNGHTENPPPNAQSKFGYAVGWYGNLFDGLVKPIVAYTVVPEGVGAPASNDLIRQEKGDDAFIGAGVQFNLPKDFIVEADYGLLNEKDAGASKTDLKTRSLVGLLRHSGERCAPFVKVISDEFKLGSVKTGSRLAYDLGVEFKESKDDMLRYHIVYTGSTVKTNMDTTTIKTNPSSIVAGLIFDAAILK